MKTRLYPYSSDPRCPKCGSHATSGAIYHTGRRGWFLTGMPLPLFKLCGNRALDHFHYRCHSCGVWHARACRDVKQQLEVA